MVVPTGTMSPWISIEPTGELWACPADRVGSGSDLLAEAMRVEGFARSIGPAIGIAEEAKLSLGWVGWIDGEDYPVVCDRDGFTESGLELDDVTRCVFACVDVLSY